MKAAVFGLQRSGTNFLETFIRENFRQLNIVNTDSRYIWKHSYEFDLNKIDSTAIHAVIMKSPYSWIESICRKKVDILKRRPFLAENKNNKNENISGVNIPELAKLWSNYVTWFFSDEVQKIIKPEIFQYEFLIENNKNLQAFAEKLKHRYDLETVYNSVQNIKAPLKVSQSDKWTDERKLMYINGQLKILQWEHVEFINTNIANNVFEMTGYKKINNIEQYIQRNPDAKKK